MDFYFQCDFSHVNEFLCLFLFMLLTINYVLLHCVILLLTDNCVSVSRNGYMVFD